jgi:acetyl-CoA carboxylase biotin carboxyl carrier protein
MIDLDFLKKLIRALDESGLDHIEIEREGTRIRVSRSPSPSPIVTPTGASAPPAAPLVSLQELGTSGSGGSSGAPVDVPPSSGPPQALAGNLVEIKSPMVGTFYRSPAPDREPFADLGDRISRGDTLCIIEAMKLMNELESEVDGIVREICMSNGDPVEYGQVLFRVEPA